MRSQADQGGTGGNQEEREKARQPQGSQGGARKAQLEPRRSQGGACRRRGGFLVASFVFPGVGSEECESELGGASRGQEEPEIAGRGQEDPVKFCWVSIVCVSVICMLAVFPKLFFGLLTAI